MAASHINADAIIHFGHACLSRVVRLPLLYVFLNFQIDAKQLSQQIESKFQDIDEPLMVFYNVGFHYQLRTFFLYKRAFKHAILTHIIGLNRKH